MKTHLFLIFFTMISFNIQAQEVVDTLDIEIGYLDSEYSFKNYYIKNQNHFTKDNKSKSDIEIDGEISLSNSAREVLSSIVLESLNKKKANSISGNRIFLQLRVNYSGKITNVMVSIEKKYASINLSKLQCKQIIQNIKKEVRFDVIRDFKDKNKYISISVPVWYK